jgi:uncharacterized protein YndB with AHSA1/START domain
MDLTGTDDAEITDAEMGEPRPFRVEVTIEAPTEVVWAAVTEPEQIRRWFGWEYDGLTEEITHIFVEHADLFPPDRIALEVGQELQIESAGESATVLRAVMPGVLDDPEADQPYDELEQGWISFFEQLRYLLERRPTGRRHTVHLTGRAAGPALVAAVADAGIKEDWHSSQHQWMAVDPAGHLVVVTAAEPIDVDTESAVTVTVNAWGGTDEELAGLREQWTRRVGAVASSVEVS